MWVAWLLRLSNELYEVLLELSLLNFLLGVGGAQVLDLHFALLREDTVFLLFKLLDFLKPLLLVLQLHVAFRVCLLGLLLVVMLVHLEGVP